MTLNVEVKKKKSPHMAITHNELQNGAANGRNIALLLKANAEVDEKSAAIIEKISGVKVEVNKASYETIRGILREALKEKFAVPDQWGDSYVYIEDFDENYVVFSNGSGLHYTTYAIDGGSISVGDDAISVSRVITFVAEDGNLSPTLVTNYEGLATGVRTLISKSFDSIKKNDKLLDILKSQFKGNLMQTEIEKAVEAATGPLRTDLEKAQIDLQKALDTIKTYEDAEKTRKTEVRKAALKEVTTESEFEDVFKSVENLDEDSFQTILKTFAARKEQLEKSDLFERKSDKVDLEKSDEVPLHVKMLQEKYKTQ